MRPSPSAGSLATEPRFSDPCGAWHTCTLAVPHLPPCWSYSPEQLCVPPPEQPYRLPTVLGAGASSPPGRAGTGCTSPGGGAGGALGAESRG